MLVHLGGIPTRGPNYKVPQKPTIAKNSDENVIDLQRYSLNFSSFAIEGGNSEIFGTKFNSLNYVTGVA